MVNYPREFIMAEAANPLVGQCGACKGTVSKSAKVCPHCGQKKPFSTGRKKSRIFKWGVLALMAWGMFSFFKGQVEKIENPTVPSQLAVSDTVRQKCLEAIRREVNNPSTLDIHHVIGYAADRLESGTQRVVQTFSAQNAFGLRQTFDAQCLLKANGEFVFRIVEQGR